MVDEAAVHQVSPLLAPMSKEEARRCFFDFMTKVTQYEELVDAGKMFLVKFRQELEHFRRPMIPMESGAVSQLVKSNYTDRLKSYLEAGCHLQHQSIWNINQLQSCEEKLEDHINKAKVLIEELECLAEDVYSTTLTASLSILEASDCSDGDNNLPADCSEDEGQSVDPLDSAVSYSSVMILVQNMLKLDYSMQEKIVKALCLKTPSSELDGYCLMWDLRPYIDDNVMQLAWKFIS
ncbi:uncharacterized protein LOC119269349 [Triticum dicoccoides]|uniref:uncharacterized protein LOC119269349 n=1 Tax=Triticum dicoccoides TaxID=85692 RepID=UPI000E7C94A6|nr:uncharacterized protein LOC119269349 [Triticum dicoccoides]XP_037407049.1 uncharacterized protein LOC119269349 [Triticum dicoccoides]XP_037407050.1 uncharacterized protein LOC119269349 [Triticum dicoccoides]